MAMFKYRQFLDETEEGPPTVIGSPAHVPNNTNAVVVLPPVYKLPCPEDYRRRAIIATIICLPFGLLALNWSYKVHKRHDDNNKAGAMRASGEASSWSIIAIGTGIFLWVVAIIVVISELLTIS